MCKRRKRILWAAAAVVLSLLFLLVWWDSRASDQVSIGFVSASPQGGKVVVFAVTNKFLFSIAYTVFTQLKAPDGNGYQFPVPAGVSNAPANSIVMFSIPAVSTNRWRPFVAYTDERFLARLRFRLDALAFSRSWWLVRDILRAESLRGIANGPEMLGNHPALPAQ